jgi:uncharacterized LabA/DUF88 family protein
METINDLRLAVLIDADNVPYGNIKGMLEEIAKYGTPTFKRIYADWTKPTVSGWKTVLLENAITPIHQYSYTTGKNATDSSMIIDAMDILYSGRVDGFCIVSSDSDFTRLATRLREAGMKVFGFGERKTPTAFISACDKFIYIEILEHNKEKDKAATDTQRKKKSTKKAQPSAHATASKDTIGAVNKGLVKLLTDSIDDLADESGWTFLGDLGNLLIKKQPDFDPRNYGFNKLLLLINSIDKFEVEKRDTGKGNIKNVYVRTK